MAPSMSFRSQRSGVRSTGGLDRIISSCSFSKSGGGLVLF